MSFFERMNGNQSRETPEVVLEARNFGKSYGHVQAVRNVSFSVYRGEIFGLIGPDGGGKTSLMRSLVSLLRIDRGALFFKGRSVGEHPDFVRRNVGYMPQRFSLYQDLTVRENLRFFAELFGVSAAASRERIRELYEFSGLEPFADRRAAALSGGMKQKLALSCMLVHSPEVIVLDEPTFGVDPISRHEFWQILTRLKEAGTTILVSTAYMDEAYQCDRVGLMFDGRILAVDKPSVLKDRYPDKLYSLRTGQPNRAHDVLSAAGFCEECNLFGDGVHFTLREGTAVDGVRDLLENRQVRFESITRIESGIEDLFLRLMKEGSHEQR
jgi:ABC-2 type transport system ATP-binding protein